MSYSSLFFFLAIILATNGCKNKFSNSYNDTVYSCGKSAEDETLTWIPVNLPYQNHSLKADHLIDYKTSLPLPISENGCVGIPKGIRNGEVLVKSLNPGVVAASLFKLDTTIPKSTINLQDLSNINVEIDCPNQVINSSLNIKLNGITEQNSKFFVTSAMILSSNPEQTAIKSLQFTGQKSEIKVQGLPDSDLMLKIQTINVGRSDSQIQKKTCNTRKDSKPPSVRINIDGMEKVFADLDDKWRQAESYSTIDLTVEDDSRVTSYYCLREENQICDDFQVYQDEIVVPDSGSYILEFYSEDELGQRSPIDKEFILVFNPEREQLLKNQLDSNDNLFSQNRLYESMISTLELSNTYEKLEHHFIKDKYRNRVLLSFWRLLARNELPIYDRLNHKLIHLGENSFLSYQVEAYPGKLYTEISGQIIKEGKIVKEIEQVIACKDLCYNLYLYEIPGTEFIGVRINDHTVGFFNSKMNYMDQELPDSCYQVFGRNQESILCNDQEYFRLYKDQIEITPNEWSYATTEVLRVQKKIWFVNARSGKVWDSKGNLILATEPNGIEIQDLNNGGKLILPTNCQLDCDDYPIALTAKGSVTLDGFSAEDKIVGLSQDLEYKVNQKGDLIEILNLSNKKMLEIRDAEFIEIIGELVFASKGRNLDNVVVYSLFDQSIIKQIRLPGGEIERHRVLEDGSLLLFSKNGTFRIDSNLELHRSDSFEGYIGNYRIAGTELYNHQFSSHVDLDWRATNDDMTLNDNRIRTITNNGKFLIDVIGNIYIDLETFETKLLSKGGTVSSWCQTSSTLFLADGQRLEKIEFEGSLPKRSQYNLIDSVVRMQSYKGQLYIINSNGELKRLDFNTLQNSGEVLLGDLVVDFQTNLSVSENGLALISANQLYYSKETEDVNLDFIGSVPEGFNHSERFNFYVDSSQQFWLLQQNSEVYRYDLKSGISTPQAPFDLESYNNVWNHLSEDGKLSIFRSDMGFVQSVIIWDLNSGKSDFLEFNEYGLTESLTQVGGRYLVFSDNMGFSVLDTSSNPQQEIRINIDVDTHYAIASKDLNYLIYSTEERTRLLSGSLSELQTQICTYLIFEQYFCSADD